MTDKSVINTAKQDIKDIKKIIERSTRLTSLSGLSSVYAGLVAIAGCFVANAILNQYLPTQIADTGSLYNLKIQLFGLAVSVFTISFFIAAYLTSKNARKKSLPIWDMTFKRVVWNLLLPIITGAAFIVMMLQKNSWEFVVPASLIFYGFALINASKYTFTEISGLGYCEIMLGFITMFFTQYSLWFWGAGFGILHIIYGIKVWRKYGQ